MYVLGVDLLKLSKFVIYRTALQLYSYGCLLSTLSLTGCCIPEQCFPYLEKYIDAVQGSDTSFRNTMSNKGRNILGPHHPRDAMFEGWNVQDFSFGDTLFGGTSSWPPFITDLGRSVNSTVRRIVFHAWLLILYSSGLNKVPKLCFNTITRRLYCTMYFTWGNCVVLF